MTSSDAKPAVATQHFYVAITQNALSLQVKFLCNRQGQPLRRYGPQFDPLDFEGDVRSLVWR